MNFVTMGQMEVKYPKRAKSIYVVQGDLDDEKVRQLPEELEGYVLINGNVNFKQSTTVHCGLIVLGNFEVNIASIHGDLQVYGNPPKAEKLRIYGNFTAKRGDEIKSIFLLKDRIYI